MAGYSTAFFDLAEPLPQRRGDDTLRAGNRWHQKMGYQKPANLDQSISQIKATEYAPFTREPEHPSIASMYLAQQFGGIRMQQEHQDYGMEDAPPQEELERPLNHRRSSHSPDRGGFRRPGPDWGNSQFGTKPRRRSIVDPETRAIFDDNAPPLNSFYDRLIADEQRQQRSQASAPITSHHQTMSLNATTNVNANSQPRRPLFDHPKAIRVSNYSDSRWPEVLQAISPFGVILEKFQGIQKHPYYEPISAKVIHESEDEVVRQSRFLFTGEGWTKVTFANREVADRLIALNGQISVGGKNLIIEAWKPDIHGRPSGDIFTYTAAGNNGGNSGRVAAMNVPSSFPTSTDIPMPGELPRRRTDQQSIFDDPFSTPGGPSSRQHLEPTFQVSTPGGSKLSTKMRGARLLQLQEMQGGIFKQKQGLLSSVMSKIWGEVGLRGRETEVKEGGNGWLAWLMEILFGRL